MLKEEERRQELYITGGNIAHFSNCTITYKHLSVPESLKIQPFSCSSLSASEGREVSASLWFANCVLRHPGPLRQITGHCRVSSINTPKGNTPMLPPWGIPCELLVWGFQSFDISSTLAHTSSPLMISYLCKAEVLAAAVIKSMQ